MQMREREDDGPDVWCLGRLWPGTFKPSASRVNEEAGKQKGTDAEPAVREFRRCVRRHPEVFSRCSGVPQQPASKWKTDPLPMQPSPSGTRVSVVPGCRDRNGNALQPLDQI